MCSKFCFRQLSSAVVGFGRPWSASVGCGRLWQVLVRFGRRWSKFLFEFLVPKSVKFPVRSDLWSDLTWSFDMIWSDVISSEFLIKFLVRISCSNFLIKSLDPSLRSRFARLGSNFYRTACPIWSLIWPDLIIWSDLIGPDQIKIIDQFLLITFLVQVCWPNFLIHLSYHDIFSYRSLQISSSTLLVILSDQFPFCSDPFFTAFKFLVQICWSSFGSCASFFWPLFLALSIDIDGSWLVYIYIYMHMYI